MLADCPFDAVFPDGADLGTVRLLAPRERAAWPCDSLSPLLVPLAEGGGRDLFAAYDPPEPGARSSVVCAVDRETGVWAPLASTFQGFAAWLLLLRRAQAGLPGHAAFAARELMEETAAAAQKLERGLGLSLGRDPVEPDRISIADRLLEIDHAAPWACSILARSEDEPRAALKVLAPALLAAPFSAGLLEQVAGLAFAAGQEKKAVRALLAALARLEPNRQAAPYRLDEPDEETGAHFEPFRPLEAQRLLVREHAGRVDRDERSTVAWQFLSSLSSKEAELELTPEEAIDRSRWRGLGGDLPGGRWILHLALGQTSDRTGRARLLDELARQWDLAGSTALARRCQAQAKAMEAGGRLG